MRITVVTPAYNAAATIGDTVRSVLAQTHRDLGLAIVDDGSTDGTAALVARFADPRLTLVRQANAGVSAARNRGTAAADGDAVLFLDADDWLAPGALATLAAALAAAPSAVAAAGPFAWTDATGAALEPGRWHPPRRPGDLLPRLLVQNQFANGGHVLIRRGALHGAGPFRTGIVYGEDWEFMVRVALQGAFTFVAAPEPLLFVRSRVDGARRRLAVDPAAFVPCMTAIFENPDLMRRFGPRRLAALRRRAEAENAWIIGREMMRQGRTREGRHWLVRSVLAAPSVRRIGLLAAAHALPLLPQAARGPFRAYSEQGELSA